MRQGPEERPRWLASWTGPTARKGAWAILDQGLISGTVFLTTLALAREGEPAEFGSFVMAVAALLTASELQNAFLTGPLFIVGPGRSPEDTRRYLTASAILQAFLAAIMAAVGIAAALAYRHFSPDSRFPAVLLAASISLFFLHAQEFARRAYFAQQQVGPALRSDLVRCGIQLSGLGFLYAHARDSLTGQNLLCLMGASAAAALLLELRNIGKLSPVDRELIGRTLRENWAVGKWTLGTTLGGIFTLHANTFIVAAFAGSAGVAALDAPRLLLAPLQIVMLGATNVLTPRACEKFRRESCSVAADFLKRAAIPWVLILLAYGVAVCTFPEFWLRAFYENRYAHTEPILLLWIGVYVILGLRLIPNTMLVAARRLDLALWPALVAGVVTLAFSAVLAPSYSAQGAVTARLIGEGLLFLMVSWMALGIHRGKIQSELPSA